MIRTVIVDDDFLVRSYLKQLNAWERAGYQIVADARDGEEALTAVEQLGPEVVITDISMPLMDGIELIRRIRETNHTVYIIVLSCHDDFEYVKEAMKLGADEYVLKNSLNEDSLYEMLVHTARQLQDKKEMFRENDETRRLMEMGRQSLKYHFFNGLLAGSFTADEREKRRKEAGIRAKYVNSAVINLFIPSWGTLKYQYSELELEQYAQRFLRKLTRELERRAEDIYDGAAPGETGVCVRDSPGTGLECAESVYLGEGVFCCFLDMSGMHRDSLMKQRLTGIATACFRCCKDEEYAFFVGVSGICFGEEGIRQAYQQARETVKLSFYEEEGSLYYEDCPGIGRILPREAQEVLEHAADYAECRQYENMKDGFEKVSTVFCKEHTDPRLVLHWIRSLDERLKMDRPQEEYAGIIRIGQLMSVCEDYGIRLFMEKRKALPEHAGAAVRRAVDYLHAHYKEQIGLSDAAKAAELNPAYLSFLFKQELGIGFSSYLLDLRMECARALLRGTNGKIKEVAREAGFNDYHYFSKAFKKINGCSPVDYRRKNVHT